jgi:hypothetical protein
MKKLIIILNIICLLSVCAQLFYVWASSLGDAFGSASGTTSHRTELGNTMFIILIIVTIISIILSHTIEGNLALISAIIPAVFGVILCVFVWWGSWGEIGRGILIFVKSPVTNHISKKYERDRLNNMIQQYKNLSRNYVYKNTNHNNEYTWYTHVIFDDNFGEFFLTYDKEVSVFMGIGIDTKNASSQVQVIGRVQDDKLFLYADKDEVERITTLLKDCYDMEGKTLFDKYKIVHDGDYYASSKNPDGFEVFPLFEKYQQKEDN